MTPVPAAPARSPSKARENLAIALLLLAILATYAGSLGGVFVYDDIPAILENPTLRHPGDWRNLIAPAGDLAGTVAGRPLLNLSLALSYAVGGTDPMGYHVLNIAIHSAAALLLFGIVRRTLRKGRQPDSPGARQQLPWRAPVSDADACSLAFVSALLWAVHPLQTEAVTYVVQRAESLMGMFFLLTLYAFIRYSEARVDPSLGGSGSRARGAGWAGLSVAGCLLGMATKEAMVAAPLIVLLYDRTFVTGTVRGAWRMRRPYYLALGATWVPLALLVASTHGRGGSAGFGTSAGVLPYALTQCGAIIRYVGLALWPRDLVFDYGTALTHDVGDAVIPILLIVILVAAAAWAWFKRPALGFLGACFFAVIAPSSSVVPIATEPMAEHRMYLPLAALCVLAVVAAFTIASGLAPRFARRVIFVMGIAAAAGLAAATVSRNRVYASGISLWADTVSKVPWNPRAHNDLAEALLAKGRTAEAFAEFNAAVEADPSYAPAQYNLGVTLLDSGRPAEAIPHLERALSAPRHLAELHLFLGEAFERTGQRVEAAGHFREAMRLSPSNAEAPYGLGNNLAAMGQYADAVEAFRTAVARSPDRAAVHNNLANTLMLAGRWDEAIVEFREALRLEPQNQSIRDNLGLATAEATRRQPLANQRRRPDSRREP